MASGSYAGCSEKPPVTSIRSPAICTAVKNTWTTKPRAAPMTTSVSAVTTRYPAVGAGRPAAILVDRSTDRASAKAALTGPGIDFELNGGASSTNPVARAVPSSSAASVVAGTERSMTASGPAEQVRQLVEQALGEADQLGEHPVAGDEQRDRHGDHLGHEGQRRLLDLGRRLEQRDQEPDQEGGRRHGGRTLRGQHHRLGRDLGEVCVAHCSTPDSFRSSVAVPREREVLPAWSDARSPVVLASDISRLPRTSPPGPW